jgi:protein TonB
MEVAEVNYAERERNPAKHLPSIALVVLLHIIIGYALVTGLARRVVEVMKQPLETKIIEEIKKPPPETPPPPPPKLAVPPPPFIPPPEVNIQVPVVTPPPTITTTTVKPPPGPPPVIQPQVVAPPQPAIRKNYKAISCPEPAYPRQLLQSGTPGQVNAWVHVTPQGGVSSVEIKSSTNRLFDREVIRAFSQCKFAAEGTGFIADYDIVFNLKD